MQICQRRRWHGNVEVWMRSTYVGWTLLSRDTQEQDSKDKETVIWSLHISSNGRTKALFSPIHINLVIDRAGQDKPGNISGLMFLYQKGAAIWATVGLWYICDYSKDFSDVPKLMY